MAEAEGRKNGLKPGQQKAAVKQAPQSTWKRWVQAARKVADRHLPGPLSYLETPKGQRWALIVVTSLVAASIIAPASFRVYRLNVGVPANETIVSPITFRVVDEEATGKNRDEVLKSVLPVYDFDDEMVRDVQARIIKAFSYMEEYLSKEAEYLAREADRTGTQTARAPADGLKKDNFRPLSDTALRTRFENLLGARVSPSAFALLKEARFNIRAQRDLRSLVVPILLKGMVLSRDLVMRDGKDGILLWVKSKAKLEKLKDLSSIFDLKEAINYINSDEHGDVGDPAVARAIKRIAMDLINVNITYNRERSAALKQEAIASLKPVYFQVAKGEPIIRKGEPVNEGHLRKLAGLNKANPAYSRYLIITGFALMFILLLRLSFYFSEKHLEGSQRPTRDLLLICLLLIGSIVMVRFMASLTPLAELGAKGLSSRSTLFAAPVATGAMLTALMVGPRMAFVFAAVVALATSMSVEGDIYLFCFYFVSGIVGLHGMTRITDRTSILKAGLIVGCANIIVVLALKLALGELENAVQLYELGFGFVGGVLSGLLASSLAPLLEPLGYITNVKLLELANHNHPLLRKLALEAPGTYHHSNIVGNLAEAAAEQIGANPLLARVGAYYHDIGKMGKKTKAGYFIENQRRGFNPHDKLEPSMSALILVSHVKNGVEKAREYRLGQPIVDIIQQHHGTNLIKYFHNKALAKAGKNQHLVTEDKYRYPGPLPQTKEAALVMLADVVEAASRTLSDPTPARIQKHVQTLIMGLFNAGQLDQSTLTLKDLHAITKSFVRALQGILHQRIDYPRDMKPQPEKPHGDTPGPQPERDTHRSPDAGEESTQVIRRLGL